MILDVPLPSLFVGRDGLLKLLPIRLLLLLLSVSLFSGSLLFSLKDFNHLRRRRIRALVSSVLLSISLSGRES